MVREGKGRIFRRKDGKYLLYLPVALVEDSMFPFREELEKESSIRVKVSFEFNVKKLIVSPCVEEE